jgi:hypothetical protein
VEARNQWQPVTEIYQQIIDPVSAANIDDDPMTMVNAARRARSLTEPKVPFGISAITFIYFLRGAIYSLFAAKLISSPDSEFSGSITLHCPALIPIWFGSPDAKALPTIMGEAFVVLAVLSLGIAFLWLNRWKPILFISMAFSGYYLAYVAISYFNIGGFGNPNLFSPMQIDLLVVEGSLNLLTFLFIALYPDLKHTFKRHY